MGFLNLHVVIYYLFLPQPCRQRGGERVVTSTAEKVVELVYMVFIDDLSEQGSGDAEKQLEAMSAASRNSLPLAWSGTSAVKHSQGHLSLHQKG